MRKGKRDEAMDAFEEEAAPSRNATDDAASDTGAKTSPEPDTKAAERDEYCNKFLRARADLENYRKRAAREIEEARRFGIIPFVRAVLHVRDDLDRTLAACADATDSDHTETERVLIEGVRLVREQFDKVLAQFGIEEIEAVGKPFDPNLHEAVAVRQTDEAPPQSVVEQVQPGFTLHDRLVRPARVLVTAPVPESQEGDRTEQ